MSHVKSEGAPSLRWLWGPLCDVLAFCVAALFLDVRRAQAVSFGCALLLFYAPRALVAARRDSAAGWRLWARLSTVAVLGYCVRAGLLDLCVSGWGWPGPAGIVVAALGTALLIVPGYGYSVRHSWRLGGGSAWRAGAIGALAVLTAMRLIYSARVELMPEEAYYWNYARHLDIGYLDHPPMVGWLVQVGRTLFGDGEFGVRLGALCCGAIGTVFTYRLTRNLFGEPSALVAAVLMQALPFFFMSGFLMTPDAPLTAAWAATLYFLERALIAERREGWWGAGVCFGLGMLSKYTIALLGASTLLFMLSDTRARAWFKRAEPYGAVLVAAAIFAPVIVWNARHEWASFVFQTSRRLAERPQFALPKLAASALVLLTPVGLAGALWVLRRKRAASAEQPSERGWRFLKFATWVPVAVFTLFSLRHEVKLDWTGAPWVALLPALGFGIVQSSAVATGWMSRAWAPTVATLMLIYGLGLYDLAVGLPLLGYGKHAELVPVGWRDLGMQVAGVAEQQRKRLGQEPLIVGLDRYALASELGFYAKAATTSGNLFGRMGLMYERWLPASEAQGRTLLLVGWDPRELSAAEIARSVDRLDPIEQGELSRDGRLIRPYFYRLAYGYHAPVGD